MTLRQKQSLFSKLMAELILWIYDQGYEVTFGDASRMDRQGHMRNSLHYIRLAMDLNLFVNGAYITDGDHPVYKLIGVKWESMNPLCAWGGRFQDANHFSLTHEGRK